MIADTVGAILLAALTLYAILAGADFGGGFWDLVAGGDARGRTPRRLIDETITPVWEANHVWLIFALVIFWTAFPTSFAAVMTAGALPLWLAVCGILLRGAGFAFRKEVQTLRWQRLLGATFALSSLVTPFFMGTVIGAVATGRVPVSARHTSLSVWTGPASLLIGALFVTVCAYLAAVFLVGEATKRGDLALKGYFVHRAELAGVTSGALSIAALLQIRHSDAVLYHGLTNRALPLVALGGGCRPGRSHAPRYATVARPASAVCHRDSRRCLGVGARSIPCAAPRYRADAGERVGAARHARHHCRALRHCCSARGPLFFAALLATGSPVARVRIPCTVGRVKGVRRQLPRASRHLCQSCRGTR